MYQKVVTLFRQNLANPVTKGPKQPEGSNVTLMAQDLLIILLPYLPQRECEELWRLSHTAINNADAGIQKRCYRTLSKLIQAGKLSSVLDVEKVLIQLTASADTVAAAAKRVYYYYYYP
jgi:ribosomal RNA-processing protein 12